MTASRARELARRFFDGTLAPTEHAELETLLGADPTAADAFADVSRLEADLAGHFATEAASERENEVVKKLARPPLRWRTRLALAASVLFFALSGLALWLAMAAERVVTGPAERRLPDGSWLSLSTGSRAVLGSRRVDLLNGSAEFNVAPGDESFEVFTPAGRIQVLGTSFRVSLDEEESDMSGKSMTLAVAVWAGLVHVEFAGQAYQLAAGQQRAFGQERDREERPRKGGTVQGILEESTEGKLTLKGRGEMGRTIDVPETARIIVDGKPGKLAGLPAGTHMLIEFDADRKVVSVSATGPTRVMTFKSATKDGITFVVRGRGEREGVEQKLPARDATVTINGKPGKVEELAAEDPVTVVLSVDGKRVLSLIKGRGEGRERPVGRGSRAIGVIKKIDARGGTITLNSPGEPFNREYSLGKEVKVTLDGKEAKLDDVKVGANVVIGVDGDGKVTVIADAPSRRDGGRGPAGMVKSVDARAGTFTIQGGRGADDKVLKLADGAKIVVEGKEATLKDIKEGMIVGFTLDREGKVTAVRAAPPRKERERE